MKNVSITEASVLLGLSCTKSF